MEEKAPTSKLQAPEKHQKPSSNSGTRDWPPIDVWKLELLWSLELGAWSFHSKNAVSGLVACAVSEISPNPISYAARPASTAILNAMAMRFGSEAMAIAVFTSTGP